MFDVLAQNLTWTNSNIIIIIKGSIHFLQNCVVIIAVGYKLFSNRNAVTTNLCILKDITVPRCFRCCTYTFYFKFSRTLEYTATILAAIAIQLVQGHSLNLFLPLLASVGVFKPARPLY